MISLAVLIIVFFPLGLGEECLEDIEFKIVKGELSATFTFPR